MFTTYANKYYAPLSFGVGGPGTPLSPFVYGPAQGLKRAYDFNIFNFE